MEQLNNTAASHHPTKPESRRGVLSLYSTDHRGQRFRVEHNTFDATRSLPDDVYQRLQLRGLAFSHAETTQTIPVLCAMLIAIFSKDVLRFFGIIHISPWVHWPVTIACAFAMIVSLHLIYSNLPRVRRVMCIRFTHAARVVVAEGVCARCQYPLSECPVEADGCRVCPECGCAWRDDCIHRHHTLVPGQRSWKAAIAAGLGTSMFVALRARTPDGDDAVLMQNSMKSSLVSYEGDDHVKQIRWLHEKSSRNRINSGQSMLPYVGLCTIILAAGVLCTWIFQTKLAIVVSLMSMGVLAVYVHIRHHRHTANALRDLHIQHNVCPWCAASLSRMMTRDDGTKECADCGCAIPMEPLQRLIERVEHVEQGALRIDENRASQPEPESGVAL